MSNVEKFIQLDNNLKPKDGTKWDTRKKSQSELLETWIQDKRNHQKYSGWRGPVANEIGTGPSRPKHIDLKIFKLPPKLLSVFSALVSPSTSANEICLEWS